jgi:hypothetical protein
MQRSEIIISACAAISGGEHFGAVTYRAGAEGEGKMTDRNSYKKWTSEDDELLRNLVLANFSPFDIAAKLGRSVSTVKARAHCLGMTLRRSRAPLLTLPDLKAEGK